MRWLIVALILFVAGILVFSMSIVTVFVVIKNKEVNDCFKTEIKVSDLIKCLSVRFPPKNSLSWSQWNKMLPSSDQRTDFELVIKQIMSSDRNCSKIQIPPSIQAEIEIRIFKKAYCVLVNRKTDPVTGLYNPAWAVVVTPWRKMDRRVNVHHSAPHVTFDYNTGNQSAAIFEKSYSYSLVVSSVSRDAVMERHSSCQPKYYPTDGAHDNTTMFHTALLSIWQWQMTTGRGCDHSNCAFIQWHGKRSCPSDIVFISAGVKNSTVYLDSMVPAVKLKNAIRTEWKNNRNLTVNSPFESNCRLLARTNIFGRILNGNLPKDACNQYANKFSGYFVHVEQSNPSRNPEYYNNWATAIMGAFPVK